MNLLSFICCETAIQDVRLNTMSLVNIWEEISSPTYPVVLPRLTCFAFVEKQGGEADIQPCRFQATLNGQVLLDFAAEVNFQGKLRSRTIAEFQGFPVMAPGDLRVAVLAGEPMVELGSWVVKVMTVGARVDLFSAGPTGPQSTQQPSP